MKFAEQHRGALDPIGRNGIYGIADAPTPSRTLSFPILRKHLGPKRSVVVNSLAHALELFLSEEIVEELYKCTNL